MDRREGESVFSCAQPHRERLESNYRAMEAVTVSEAIVVGVINDETGRITDPIVYPADLTVTDLEAIGALGKLEGTRRVITEEEAQLELELLDVSMKIYGLPVPESVQ